MRADLDVYVTFEGDNTVLLQLVAKRLLADYANEFRHADFGVMARWVAHQAADVTLHRTGLRQVAQTFADSGSERKSANYLKDPETQRQLLTDRVSTMVAGIGGALRNATRLPQKEAAALFNEHQHELIEAARAHAELLQWEAFTAALTQIEDHGTRQVLTWLRDLFGLSLVEKNLGWYLMYGRLSAQRARILGTYINRLLSRLRPHARDLVDAFGYGPEHLRAKIASGAEQERQDEAMAYARSRRASGEAPVDEKVLIARRKAAERLSQKRQKVEAKG